MFKVGDTVRVTAEKPYYRFGANATYDADIAKGTVLVVSSDVDDDGDVQVVLPGNQPDGADQSISTECLELVSREASIVVNDSVILDKLDEVRKVAKAYANKQFVRNTNANGTESTEALLMMFFLETLNAMRGDSDGTV
jgi:hypothetical protein